MSSIEQQALSQVLPEAQNQSRTIRSVAPSATNSGVYKSASNASVRSNAYQQLSGASAAGSNAPSRKNSIHSNSSAALVHSNESANVISSPVAASASTIASVDVSTSVAPVSFVATPRQMSFSNSRKPSAAGSYIPNQSFDNLYSRKPSQISHRNDSIGSAAAHVPGSNEVSNRIALDLIELLRNNTVTNSASGSAFTHQSQSYSTSQAQFSASSQLLSDVEAAILRSNEPVQLSEIDEIEVLGQRGIWANKAEVLNWRGVIPISEYKINIDPNPEVITKKSHQTLNYIQELAIRYLRPPTPPAPGEIVITQEANVLTPPAPPLVIRQQPARPETPEPLVIREAPPPAPLPVGRKLITISGKRIPPPPRKVVIERLAQLPAKPQSVLIERWLPYAEVKRRVIFQAAPPDPIVVAPRNTVVQWEAPEVQIRKEFKYLGVIRANPAEYVQTYGQTLRVSHDLPDFVQDIKTPEGLVLAANYKSSGLHELEGDLHALKLVDLDKEGLSGYRQYLIRLGVLENAAAHVIANSSLFASSGSTLASNTALTGSHLSTSASNDAFALDELITQIFQTIDRNHNGRINVEDAEKTLLRLNSRLGRRYGEDDVRAFFNVLDINNDGSLDLEEFKRAFLNIAV